MSRMILTGRLNRSLDFCSVGMNYARGLTPREYHPLHALNHAGWYVLQKSLASLRAVWCQPDAVEWLHRNAVGRVQMQKYLSVEKAAYCRLEPLDLSSRFYYVCRGFSISYFIPDILAQQGY